MWLFRGRFHPIKMTALFPFGTRIMLQMAEFSLIFKGFRTFHLRIVSK